MKNEAVVGSAALKTAEEEVFHVGASAATLEQGSMNDACGYDATGETNARENSMSDSDATNVAETGNIKVESVSDSIVGYVGGPFKLRGGRPLSAEGRGGYATICNLVQNVQGDKPVFNN